MPAELHLSLDGSSRVLADWSPNSSAFWMAHLFRSSIFLSQSILPRDLRLTQVGNTTSSKSYFTAVQAVSDVSRFQESLLADDRRKGAQ